MPLVPYKPDVEAWIQHFKRSVNNTHTADFYPIEPMKSPSPHPPPPVQVTLVTPVQQAVEQAQAILAKQKKKMLEEKPDETTLKKKRRTQNPWDNMKTSKRRNPWDIE